MAKTTKRSKKFIAKGGAKGMLEKKGSTIAKKGKPVMRSKKKRKDDDNAAGNAKGNTNGSNKERNDEKERQERERSENDFTSTENLGSLDIDSFFEKAAGMKGDFGGEENDDNDEESNNDDDVNNDDDEMNGGVSDSEDDLDSLDSEEEDIAASEARLKKQLGKLAEKDPEFHKYLRENESSLLEFGEDEDDHEEEQEEMGDDDMEGDAEEKPTKVKRTETSANAMASDKFLLTPQRLESLEESAFTSHSIKGLKRIISAFKTACHLSDASGQGRDKAEDSDEEEDAPKKKREFQITSPVVFDRLMAVCLAQCHEEFCGHLLEGGKSNNDHEDEDSDESSENGQSENTTTLDENKPLNPKLYMKSPNWPALRPYLESFLKSTLHLLSEAGKEANLLKVVLQALAKYVPFLTAFPRLGKLMLKTCVKLWSAPLDTSEEYQFVRLQAFLRIRQLAITQPYPFIEDCLKMTYLSYAQRSKFGTASNVTTVLPTLTFMGNCIVELYTLDYASAYQHAFVYIRQLALHLRTALMKKTKESMAMVYCWQYMHCLKLWVAVLSAACGRNGSTESAASSKLGGGAGKDEEANLLRSLVFPLTEIILGVTRLVPITRYTPLRLHCVRLLQQLAASTESFIPTTFLLLGVLDSKEVRAKPLRDDGRGKSNANKSKSTVRGVRLPLILKLPKEGTLRTIEQLDAVLKETFLLLNREIDLYRYSPGFPEFTFVILQRLRKFNKEVNNGRWRAYSKGSIELCEKYSSFIVQERATLVDAPKDVRRLEALKPTNVPSMRERYDSAVSKEKRLEAVSAPVVASSEKMKQAGTKGRNDKRKGQVVEDDDSESDDKEFVDDDDDDEEEESTAKPAPKKQKVAAVNEADLNNVAALEQEDEVQEGIVWSDSE
eukprot:CCRYP_011289-RA/>CCRYP_011289-RA protein AED:0.13 eAED:0.13 QI:268/1/1/1/1/1/2/130/893